MITLKIIHRRPSTAIEFFVPSDDEVNYVDLKYKKNGRMGEASSLSDGNLVKTTIQTFLNTEARKAYQSDPTLKAFRRDELAYNRRYGIKNVGRGMEANIKTIEQNFEITDLYRELNHQMHLERPNYGVGGHLWVGQVRAVIKAANAKTVLDYGCGKKSLESALGYPINNYDPAIPEHSAKPEPADVVACIDVLEHIEPTSLEAVLNDLRRVIIRNGIFLICTQPAGKTLPDGRNAHLIIESGRWWMRQLLDRFHVQQYFDFEGELMFIVGPADRQIDRPYAG